MGACGRIHQLLLVMQTPLNGVYSDLQLLAVHLCFRLPQILEMLFCNFVQEVAGWEGRGAFLYHADAAGGGTSCNQTNINYVLCTPTTQDVAVWDGRGAFLYHVDAGGDIAAQSLTLAHLAHIWVRAGFSFSLVKLRQSPAAALFPLQIGQVIAADC